MADIVDIALSAEASGVADSILEKGLFKNKSDVMTFAAAYMIKYYFDEFDPSTYYQSDNNGSNYSYSTFDSDGKWSTLIKALYPNTGYSVLVFTCTNESRTYFIESEDGRRT